MNKLTDLKDVRIDTISDLETFFLEKGISEEKTRFFINEDRKERQCFGIYQDVSDGKYIVYKNKSDGSRFIRYEGESEKEAVNIFFSKFKDEMYLRDNKRNTKTKKKKKKYQISTSEKAVAIFATAFIIAGLASFVLFPETKKGYYNYQNNWYYYESDTWYYYDDYYSDWFIYDDIVDQDYFYGEYISEDEGIKDAWESENYVYDDSYDSSYSDSDFDSYDFDSWDSSDTDWDSDW